MLPIFLKIGFLKITWYGLMAACGFLAASLVIYVNRKKAGLSEDNVQDIAMIAVLAGILGARLFYVIQFWRLFKFNFIHVFFIHEGGLVFYGGFITAIVAIAYYCQRKRIDIIRLFDIIAPALAVGHFFGRIGCFMNGCCFGKPTGLPWAVSFPEGSFPYSRYGSAGLHPVQLYEAVFNLVLGIFLFFCIRKTERRGLTSGLYFLIYGTGRFLIELLRGDHENLFLGIFTNAQSIGFVMMITGFIFITMALRGKDAGQNV